MQRTCKERATHVQGLPYPTQQYPTVQNLTLHPLSPPRGGQDNQDEKDKAVILDSNYPTANDAE